jgi:hypothetical protein
VRSRYGRPHHSVPCNPTDTGFSTADLTDIYAFETQVISDYLALHNISLTVPQFLAIAGKEMRDDVRSAMLLELEGIIGMTSSQRTSGQQAVYNWFDSWASQEEAQTYKLAYGEYQTYAANPCTYQLNATIASEYNIQLDTTNCNFLGSLFTQPAQPSATYYVAVGLQQTWGKLLTSPGAVATYTTLGHYAQFALSQSVLGGGGAAGLVASNFTSLSPFAQRDCFRLGNKANNGSRSCR